MFLVGPCRRRPLESSLRGLLESSRKPAGGTFSLGHYQLDEVVWRDQGSCERLTSVHTWSCMRVLGCSWCLCISMLYSQLIIMRAWACDYAHLCCADSLWLCMHVREHVTIHIYAMQSACDYACMCMCLCISMLCSQLIIMHAWACDYAPLCCADSLWLCMHVRLIRHIYAMQSACNQVCMCIWLCTFKLCSQLMTMHACACDDAHLCYAVNL